MEETIKIKFHYPAGRNAIILKVCNVYYFYLHESFSGDTVYCANCRVGHRTFRVEMIKLKSNLWCFHVERKEKMFIDSRIGNKYYHSAGEAQNGLLTAFSKKFNKTLVYDYSL
jgi:hypothetical protein